MSGRRKRQPVHSQRKSGSKKQRTPPPKPRSGSGRASTAGGAAAATKRIDSTKSTDDETTAWAPITAIIAVVALLAATVVAPVWFQLVIGVACLVGTPFLYFMFRSGTHGRLKRGLVAALAVAELVSGATTVTAVWSLTHAPILKTVANFCDNAAATSGALTDFFGPYSAFLTAAPRYEGPLWENLQEASATMANSARKVDDPALQRSAEEVRDSWANLTGTQLEPIPEPYFSQGLIALGDVANWCKAQGLPVVQEPDPSAPAKRITLLQVCNDSKILLGNLNATTSDGLVSNEELNDLSFTAGTLNLHASTPPQLLDLRELGLEDYSELADTPTGAAVAGMTYGVLEWLDRGALPADIMENATNLASGCQPLGLTLPAVAWDRLIGVQVQPR